MVCHKCDTPKCVNPDHLFVGTAKDNMEDCKKKGRSGGGTKTPLLGESNPRAKLSPEHIVGIRTDDRPQRAIAKDFGVTQALVSKIKRNEIWRHV
jgi:DNA invertase Pin-like site-specific DNA recombinase